MEFGAGRRLPILQHSNTPILHYPITPIPNTYGFTEKTAQSENQQTQTAQEAPRPSSQEAHVAEVGLPGGRILPAGAGPCREGRADVPPARPRRTARFSPHQGLASRGRAGGTPALRWRYWQAAPRRYAGNSLVLRQACSLVSCLMLLRMQRSAVLGAVVLGLAGCALPSTSRREAASAKTAEGNWTGPVDDYSPSAVQARTTAHAHYAAAILYSLDEQPERAGEEFFKAAMADLSNDALTVEASSRLLDLRKADRAIELLTNATARAGASGAVYARLGRAYAMAGKRDLAIDANRKAIKKNPELLAGYQYLAHLYLQNKQVDQAMNVLDEAGRQPRADAAYLIELAETYGMLFQRPGRTDKVKSRALEVLKRAAALKPAKSVLVQRLAEEFFEFGAPERAAETLAPLVERLPQMPGLRERLVDLLVRSNPGSLPINSMLGRLLLFDRKPKEAVEYLGQALRLNAGADPDYFFDLAEAQINADEPKAALETLNRARKS